jgi:hypothetical protein
MVWCRSAGGLLLFGRLLAQRQQTTAVGRGGGLHKYQTAAADALQLPLLPRSGFRARLSSGVAMICFATACAKRTCKTCLLVQALSKSSDFLMGTQSKS